MALIPVLIVIWLIFELYFRKRRSFWNAMAVTLIVWLLCTTIVNWVTTAHIALWWAIALLAGLLVSRSFWPQTKSFD